MIYKFEELDSTNEYLKREHTRYSEYDVILAKNQTQGKARRGNNWKSSEGMALFTFYINKNENYLMFPIISALAVINALNKIEPYKYMFKWTNDVYLDGKKLCGILTENYADKIMIGIGININNDINADIKNIAISMKEKFNREYIIENIVENIIQEFKSLKEKLDENTFNISEINKINYLKDKNIVFKVGDTLKKGICKDILPDGKIQIEIDDTLNSYSIGEIIRERVMIDISMDNVEERIYTLQKQGYDVIGISYNATDIKKAQEIADKTKIILVRVEKEEYIENILQKYAAKLYKKVDI